MPKASKADKAVSAGTTTSKDGKWAFSYVRKNRRCPKGKTCHTQWIYVTKEAAENAMGESKSEYMAPGIGGGSTDRGQTLGKIARNDRTEEGNKRTTRQGMSGADVEAAAEMQISMAEIVGDGGGGSSTAGGSSSSDLVDPLIGQFSTPAPGKQK